MPPYASEQELASFRALLGAEGRAVLERIPRYDGGSALDLATRLRAAGVDAGLAAAAMTQARLRARAVTKFGAVAASMWFTADGLEQATRPEVAVRHAARFAAVTGPGGRVADLCCGIGGDLVALARGLPGAAPGGSGHVVLGVDRDPLAVAVAVANAAALGVADRVEVRCADVTATDLTGRLGFTDMDGAFVDPARRGEWGRALHPRAWSPPLDWVLALAGRVPATGAKLAPGVPHDVLPEDAEAEWVSVGGDVVECALWCGPLATGVRRRATLLPSGAGLTGDGTRRAPPGPVGGYLLEPDGAVIRAGLVAELADAIPGARLLDPTIAYLTCDAAPRPDTEQFATAYQVIEVLPFNVKRLRDLLRARGVGRVTIKKRGTAVTPESLRGQLRLRGDNEATVVLTRIAGRHSALLVDRL